MTPWTFLLAAIAGWMNRRQQQVIEYFREENRVLREHVGRKRLLLTHEQKRRLAVKGKSIGRKLLPGIDGKSRKGWRRGRSLKPLAVVRQGDSRAPGGPDRQAHVPLRRPEDVPEGGLGRGVRSPSGRGRQRTASLPAWR